MIKVIYLIGVSLSGIPPWIPLVNTILLIISTILLGVLVFLMFLLLFGSRFNIFGSCIRRFHKKPRKPKIPDFDKEIAHNKKKDPNHFNNIYYDKPEIKNLYNTYHDSYCDKKYDPSIGYSLDCNHKNTFPYNNHNNKFY
jgi:hypothetical protein